MKYLPYQHDFLDSFDDVQTLFILVAMASEEQALLAGNQFEQKEFGVKELTLGHRKVVVGQSGVGLVNAAIQLYEVMQNYATDAVLLLGVGGALDPGLQAGDTVIAKQVIQHDSFSSQEQQNVLIAPGQLTLSAADDQQVDPVMKTDSKLRAWVRESLAKSPGRIYEGTILSGSEFVADMSRKAELLRLDPEALLVDMEAAALAQLCREYKIPFAAAKTVADRARANRSMSDDYKAFLAVAARNSQLLLQNLEG